MKPSTFIATLIGALIIGGGIAALLLVVGNAQTQIVIPEKTCTVSDLDQDGDCIAGDLDFYPYDPLR
ncbi:MAG: hypothetical protein U0517_01840 [Candidatus Andersenbacteria bacterium]